MRIDEEVSKKAFEAGAFFEQYHGACSQCTIAAVAQFIPIPLEVFKCASVLAGGLFKTGRGPCGAFLAGLLVFSSYFGRSWDEFMERKPAMGLKDRELAAEYQSRFLNTYGGTGCMDIQKTLFGRWYDLSDPAEYEKFEQAGAHTEKCTKVVGDAARWVLELMAGAGVEIRQSGKGA